MLRPSWAYALLLSGLVAVVVALTKFLPVSAQRSAAKAARNDDSDLASIRAAIALGNKRCTDALRRADPDSYVENFVEDSISMPGLGPIVRGRDAIRSAMVDSFEQLRFDHAHVDSLELRVAGDVAYEAGNYRFIVTNGNGRPQTLTGRYLVVWRRQHDAWRIAVDVAQPGAPAF